MMTRLKAALAIAAGALAPLPALAQTAAAGPGYWHDSWEWGWGHMAFGSIMMVLFWGGIIVVIVLAVKWLGPGQSQPSGYQPAGKRAVDILQDRFARGEIDKQEFEERRRLLAD